ncbi:MAG: hypothetical protein JRJ65_05045 [Deltaproteobacteria bacterium]|nr:hypothetical protein [Deltaproteobacteria bacterium]
MPDSNCTFLFALSAFCNVPIKDFLEIDNAKGVNGIINGAVTVLTTMERMPIGG